MGKISQKILEFGKKGKFNLLIALLCLFLINTYTFVIDILKHIWKKLYGKSGQRAVAMTLAVCIIFTMIPKIVARAESETKAVTFLSFIQLQDEIKEQNVSVGTALDMLNLPTSITALAVVDIVVPETPPVEMDIDGVTWDDSPIYDSQETGTYIFTAVIPNGYIVEDGISLPQITVIVSQAEQTAVEKTIAMIDTLPTMDEWLDMEEADIRAVVDKVISTKAAFDALTGEEKKQIDELHTAKLEELAELASGVASAMPMAADDIQPDTVFGGCTWKIDSAGVLTIRPTDNTTGILENIYDNAPWKAHNARITSVVVESGVKANEELNSAFRYFSICTTMDLSGLDTSAVTNMFSLFNGCAKLASLDLSGFNTEKVENIGGMFSGCSILTSINLSSFNTINVISMRDLFLNAKALTTIEFGDNFNTAKVTDMSGMFYGCAKLTSLDLSGFNTELITSMHGFFYNCGLLTELNLSNFNTAQVTTMARVFDGCWGLTNIIGLSSFNTEKVTNMSGMFKSCSKLTTVDVSKFNTAAVTDMSSMFGYCSNLTTIDLSNFNTEKVTNMSSMFANLNITAIDLSNFNTEKVTNMSSMFGYCTKLTNIIGLSEFDTSNVTNMSNMFTYIGINTLDLSNFIFTNMTNVSKMFELKKIALKTDYYKNIMGGTKVYLYNKNSVADFAAEKTDLIGTEINIVYNPETITKVITGGTITTTSRHSASDYQDYFIKTAPLYPVGTPPPTYVRTNNYAQRGEVITITLNPSSGHHLDTLTVTKTNVPTEVVTVTDNKFTMPDYPVTITATFKLPGFPVTITTRKDNTEWVDHGKTYKLTSDRGQTFITDLTAVPAGSYDIYYDNTKTGATVNVNDMAISAIVDYYTITFYDENVVQSTQIVPNDGYATKPLTTPSKIGYTFAKWVTTDGGSTEFDFATKKITTTTNVYTSRTANTYTVIFDVQGGTVIPATQTVTFYAAYGTLPIPTKTGYTFKGWFTEATGGTEVTVDTIVTATDNHTIYARWADETAPSAPVLQAGTTLPSDWTKSQATIPLTLSDGVGVAQLWVKMDTTEYVQVDNFESNNTIYAYPTSEGTHTYQFMAKDAANNTSTDSIMFTVKLDKTAPVVNIDGIVVTNGSKDFWNWIVGKKNMIIKVPVTDEFSGVKSVSYTATPDSGAAITKTVAVTDGKCEIILENDFFGTIKLIATDNADNTTGDISLTAEGGTIVAEDTAPTIDIKVGSSSVSESYYETAPTLIVTVRDDADSVISGGINSIVYKIGNFETTVTGLPGTSAVYYKTFTILETEIKSRVNTITITAIDNAGNTLTSTVTVKVKGPETTPVGEIDYTDEKITALIANEIYIINTIEKTADVNGKIAIENQWFGKTVGIIKKGDNSTTIDSESQNLLVKDRPITPAPVGKNITYPGATDGKITNINNTMEYKKNDESNTGEWISISGNEVNVTAGTYEVRVKSTTNSFKSQSSTVTIDVVPAIQQDTPKAAFEASTVTLSNVSSEMKYSTDNGSIWKNISSITTDLSKDTLTERDGILVIHKGNQKEKLDSKTQKMNLTKKDIPIGIKSTNEKANDANDGTLTGVSTEMEYQQSGEIIWTSIESDKVIGLAPSTYNIRVKGSGYALQSDYVSVVIKPYNKVIIPVVAVTVLPNTRVLTLRQSVRLETTIEPANATNQIVKWASSAPSVATVDGTGLVNTISVGKATITATTDDSNKKATCLITVKPSGGVEGIISDKYGPVFGAEVEVREGGTDGRLVGGPILTDIDGHYSFSNLPQSIYSLVVKRKVVKDAIQTDKTQTVTRIITVDNDIVTSDILMPDGETNTTVEVKPNTPSVAVEGLDSAFTNEAAVDEDKGITTGDADKIKNGAKVDITLTAQKKEEYDVADDAGKIQESAGETKEIGLLLDLSLFKSVKEDGAEEQKTQLTGFNSLLKIVVPLSDSLLSKSDNLSVMRVHDGEAKPIENGGTDDAERFTIESENLILHVKNFSTYAVVNNKTIVVPPSNSDDDFSSQNSEYTITATAYEGGTISPSGGVKVSKYSDKTFTVTSDDGWKLDKVMVDGKREVKLTDGKYTFKSIAKSYTIDAYFIKQDIPSPKPIPKPNPELITKPNKPAPVVDTKDHEKDNETVSSNPEEEEIAVVAPELPKVDTPKSFCLINWIAGGNTQIDCWWCWIIVVAALTGIFGGALFIIKRNKKK